MNTKNTLLKKYLLPYYINGYIFIGLATALTIVFLHNETKPHILQQKAFSGATPNSNVVIWLMLVAVCLFLSNIGINSTPNKKRKDANDLTKKYINNIVNKNPELQQYVYLLNNPEIVENLTTFICNDLSDDEQQEIISCINKFDAEYYNNPKNETEKALQHLNNKILVIVTKHANQHPEFIRNIINIMQKSSKTYILQPTEKTR